MRDTQIGRLFLSLLKATGGTPGPSVMIPVGSPTIAFLRPVATKRELLNAADVRVLTDWRNRFVQAFLTEFIATESRTAQWLVEAVGPNEGKILFMVADPNGRTFGYMGLDYIDWGQGYGEADAVVRGADAAPGTMKCALQTMLGWAQGQLGLGKLGVRVRSDNTALEFYRKVGYQEIFRVPLRSLEEPGMIRWVEDPSVKAAETYLVHMVWGREGQRLTRKIQTK